MDVNQLPDAVATSEVNGGAPVGVVTACHVVRRDGDGDTAVDALRGVAVDIARGN
jgi:hypothetical protein